MTYLVQNITFNNPILGPDGTPPPSPIPTFVYGKNLFVSDIPNVSTLKWYPGEIIDLETICTNAQILQSHHLRVHILIPLSAINTTRLLDDTYKTIF